MQGFQLEIWPEGTAFFRRAVEIWQEQAAAAIRQRGRFTVALAGGNTPRKLYAALTQAPGIPWQQTWLFWGDERWTT